jgi:L,D-transpeptidase YcbB
VLTPSRWLKSPGLKAYNSDYRGYCIAVAVFWLTLAPNLGYAAPGAGAIPDWTVAQAQALLQVVDKSAQEGLDPKNYASDGVRAALAQADQTALNKAANALYLQLAQDFLQGHTPPAQRQGWHYSSPVWPLGDGGKHLAAALAATDVQQSLYALLPQHPEYQALKAALAKLPAEQTAQRQAVLATLEQWRWLPRDLGGRYLLVNVPEYRVALFDKGTLIAQHHAIVGKPATPTLLFADVVTRLVLNPSWEMPPTILREVVAPLLQNQPEQAQALGYDATYDLNGKLVQVIQNASPTNPMGRVKFIMPGNNFDILLHDTPHKELFANSLRALSFGCVRVERPFDLAVQLLQAEPGWSKARINQWLGIGATLSVDLEAPVPTYLVYLTARITPDGLVVYPDVYGHNKPKPITIASPQQAALPVQPLDNMR